MHPNPALSAAPAPPARLYRGWAVVLVAAAAMAGRMPGRTQGLGLVTEPLIAGLGLDRVTYAQLNLRGTIAGAWLVQVYGWRSAWLAVGLARIAGLCVSGTGSYRAMFRILAPVIAAIGMAALRVAPPSTEGR